MNFIALHALSVHCESVKDQIKAWLKAFNHDREWLAEQIGVNKRTVDNWLSSPKEIPIGKLKLIERLMSDDAAAEERRRQQHDPVAQVFSVEVTLPQFRRYSAAALQAQQTLEQWAISELDAAADAYFGQQAVGDSVPSKPSAQPPDHGSNGAAA